MSRIGGQEPDDGRVAALLRGAADDVPVPAAPVAAIIRRGERRHRHLLLVRVAAAVAASVLVVGVVAALRGLDGSSGEVTGPAPITAGCAASVPPRLLPDWARTGFSDPRPQQPYVLGDHGDIAAILFGGPLMAAPAADRANKILWVSRLPVDLDALKIEATLAGSDTVVHREVPGGPGPSIIDLPAAGCWQLRLSWNGHTDTLRLYYSPGPP